MGCTNSKENTNSSFTTIDQENQQIITEQFRQWLTTHRATLEDYLLNQIRSSSVTPPASLPDYRPIISRSLDLLTGRSDVKTLSKLNKLLQKDLPQASPKKISQTIELLQHTAQRLHQGEIHFDNDQQTNLSNGDIQTNSERKSHPNVSAIEPGIALKEALEKARISFYKGKQAAIFANPNGGYDVRIIDDNDDALKQDGNLLRSIIVTEVKMRPKPAPPPPSSSSSTTNPASFHIPPPPPPSTKLLNEHEIGEDFRRSIDAALKGLEAIYQTTPVTAANVNEESQVSPHVIPSFDETHSYPSKTVSFEENHKTLADPSLTSALITSPSHNVTYTEIIHSESRDGEQSRRFLTESYDELPTKEDEQTTSLKVRTKSEFSTRPASGEKIMEQSVQIITVKVRNETTISDNEISS